MVIRTRSVLLLMSSSLALAGPLPATAQDAPPPVGEQSTTTQTTSSETTQTRSSRSEIDISIDDGADDDWGESRGHGARHRRDDVDERDLFGQWTLGQEGGNSCTIELKDSTWFGGYGAWVPAGCPDGVFSVNRWLLSGNDLLLTDTNNTVIARFRQSGSGRWSGRRVADGARLYLNPQGSR
ncbi:MULTISPECIES: AprI/Inh family metalloprotease inhibitor [Stenotrophomonas]|uniref:AprI/Inh family metalloprotease inhibitor n=1 Tax=Stenotrophomonas TaxID=40323 RepID=UPI001F1EA596|nr:MULTISPECIES: AprI/Inh family metalloprotease inhibitor [Stenotrophomonas]